MGLSLLDERLDAVALTARQVLGVRVAVGTAAAALVAYVLGPMFAGLWYAAFAACTLLETLSTAPLVVGEPMTKTHRFWNAVFSCAAGLTWCGVALGFWTTGIEPYRLAAMAVLTGLLIHAQTISFRSPISLAVVGVPPAVLPVLLPTFMGGYAGKPLALLAVSLLLLLLYVGASARANMRSADALSQAECDAKTANAAKSTFLAVMSHELRTPLNGVLGMARALAGTRLDPRQKRYVETIARSGDGLMTILNDILDISKIEAGRMDLDVAAFDLRALSQQVVDLWVETAGAKGLELTLDASPDLPDALLGDETRVRQILMNLVSNALKFTREGAVQVGLKAAPSADGDGAIEITVSDSGVGMTAEHLAGLFRPFAQAEASTARTYGGTGLGLAICRQLTAMMGGEINVESQTARGTTFRVWLPLPAAPADVAMPEDTVSLHAVSILVVDDNPINQTVARAVLEAAGAEIETASDGSEALERLRKGAFDLVLMDVHMPVMDGVEAVSRIRSGAAGRRDIPIIALTGEAMAGEEARLRALGFDALQAKPVQPASLILSVARVLEARGSGASDAVAV